MSDDSLLPAPPPSPRPPSYRPLPPPRDVSDNDQSRPPPYIPRVLLPPPYVRGDHPPLPPTPAAPPVPPRSRAASGGSRVTKKLPSLPIVAAEEIGGGSVASMLGGNGEGSARLPVAPDGAQLSIDDSDLRISAPVGMVAERPLPALPDFSPSGRLGSRTASRSSTHHNPVPALPTAPTTMRPLPPLPNTSPNHIRTHSHPLPWTPIERPLPIPPNCRDTSLLARHTHARSASDTTVRFCTRNGADTTPPLPPLPGTREKVPPLLMALRARRGARRNSCEGGNPLVNCEGGDRGHRRGKLQKVRVVKQRVVSGLSERGKERVDEQGRESAMRKEEGAGEAIARRHSTGRRTRFAEKVIGAGWVGWGVLWL